MLKETLINSFLNFVVGISPVFKAHTVFCKFPVEI